MIQIPNSREELQRLEKENNGIIKIAAQGKMNGLYPAFRKVAKWVGYKDEWDVYFVAAKQYHTLLDMQMNAAINNDYLMGNLKQEYQDSFQRIVRICKTEIEAINYLQA